MALKQANMEYNAIFVTGASISAGVGESILVKDVLVYGASVTWAKVMIDRQTVGYFMCENMPIGSHLGTVNLPWWRTMIGFMRERFGFPGYPVGEGQEFSVQLIGGTGSISILYDLYDAGDITPESVNGTASDELLYVAYGSISASQVTTAGEYKIDYSYMPAEFCDFPFGVPVPGGTEINLLGICFSTRVKADGSSANNVSYTRYLKVIRNREVMFSETKEGLVCFDNYAGNATSLFIGGGMCRYGDFTTKSYRQPFVLDEPMTFRAGDELLMYWVTGATSTPGRLNRDDLVASLILRMRRV
jgi:hypothetical protein